MTTRRRADRSPGEAEFERFFRAQFPIVCRTAGKVVDPTSAEDIAVEALARAYARWDSVSSMEYPLAWVIRVATNLALDQLRKKQGRPELGGSLDSDEAMVRRSELIDSLRRLPRRQQEVVVLRYIVDMSEQEVADTLQMSPGTVKTHLHRALPRLRLDLSEQP